MEQSLLSPDTSRDAAQRQTEVLRAMGAAGRAELTIQLSENLKQVTLAGIRHRHPNYSQQQVTQAYLKLILEKELYEKVFPGCEISA